MHNNHFMCVFLSAFHIFFIRRFCLCVCRINRFSWSADSICYFCVFYLGDKRNLCDAVLCLRVRRFAFKWSQIRWSSFAFWCVDFWLKYVNSSIDFWLNVYLLNGLWTKQDEHWILWSNIDVIPPLWDQPTWSLISDHQCFRINTKQVITHITSTTH